MCCKCQVSPRLAAAAAAGDDVVIAALTAATCASCAATAACAAACRAASTPASAGERAAPAVEETPTGERGAGDLAPATGLATLNWRAADALAIAAVSRSAAPAARTSAAKRSRRTTLALKSPAAAAVGGGEGRDAAPRASGPAGDGGSADALGAAGNDVASAVSNGRCSTSAARRRVSSRNAWNATRSNASLPPPPPPAAVGCGVATSRRTDDGDGAATISAAGGVPGADGRCSNADDARPSDGGSEGDCQAARAARACVANAICRAADRP